MFESWTRENLGVRHEKANKFIEEKENYCWLKGYRKSNKIAKEAPNNMIDRAGDIYEILAKFPQMRISLIGLYDQAEIAK